MAYLEAISIGVRIQGVADVGDDRDYRAKARLEDEINALIDSDPDYRRITYASRRVVKVGYEGEPRA